MKTNLRDVIRSIFVRRNYNYQNASLTVEAALVMPVFLYFMIAFLYFIQIFTLQERIQSEITQMGLAWSKTAYFYKDFPDVTEAVSFDKSIFGNELDIAIDEITDKIISGASLKLLAGQYLDKDFVNKSCIKDGFDGIDFYYSSVTGDEDVIDIVLRYQINIPVKLFKFGDMSMLQRVRLRTWTGYEVAAAYETEESSNTDETVVYIAETGTVYHKSKNCSHIKLSVTSVDGIPYELRNQNGAKYTMCEDCCTGNEGANAIYYITKYGTKYHSDRNCSGIKRSIQEIDVSEVGSRTPCSRCSK